MAAFLYSAGEEAEADGDAGGHREAVIHDERGADGVEERRVEIKQAALNKKDKLGEERPQGEDYRSEGAKECRERQG